MPSVAFYSPPWRARPQRLRQTAEVKAHGKGPQSELKGRTPGAAACAPCDAQHSAVATRHLHHVRYRELELYSKIMAILQECN